MPNAGAVQAAVERERIATRVIASQVEKIMRCVRLDEECKEPFESAQEILTALEDAGLALKWQRGEGAKST